MDYHLFWQLNPRRLQPFLKAHELKEESKLNEMNIKAWLNGAYFRYAIASTFGKERYPTKVIDLTGDQQEKKDEETKVDTIGKFGLLAITFNNAFEKRGGK